MKNAIKYYYNLSVDNIHFLHQVYYFSYLKQKYVFIMYKRTMEEVEALYELNMEVRKNNLDYHEMILNKDRNIITFIDKVPYVLLKLATTDPGLIDINDLQFLPIILTKKNQILNRFNWVYLWSKKIDYIEYQLEHIKSQHFNFIQNLWYYIGLGENAISYIENTLLEEKPLLVDDLTICHRRVKFDDQLWIYYNPLSLIIDHPVRDISEYLKSCFLEEKYDFSKIENYFETVSLSPYGYRLLFGRMLFPSFYFDAYEKMIDNKITEKELIIISEKGAEYEKFLSEIYYILKKYSDLPTVNWLTKKMCFKTHF